MNRMQPTHKEFAQGIEKTITQRVDQYGSISVQDLIAALWIAMNDGKVTAEEVAQFERMTATQSEYMEPFARAMVPSFLEQLRSKVVAEGSIPAEPTQILVEGLDARIVGTWEYTNYVGSGEFSVTVNQVLALYPDGRFVFNRSASANLKYRDSSGNRDGMTSLFSNADPGDRGRWTARNGRLRLEFENDTYIDYVYLVDGSPGNRGLLTKAGGKQKYWVEL
jgi:hypothetical protein